MRSAILGGLLVLGLGAAAAQSGEEPAGTTAWFARRLADVEFTNGGTEPKLGASPWVVIDGEGEAWIAPDETQGFHDPRNADSAGGTLAVQVPVAREVTGRLWAAISQTSWPTREAYSLGLKTTALPAASAEAIEPIGVATG